MVRRVRTRQGGGIVGLTGSIGLLTLGLLPIVGALLGGPAAWGFHCVSFLPRWAIAIAVAGWAVLLIPPLRRGASAILVDRFGGRLFGRSSLPVWVAASAAGAAFFLLRVKTHLLGDGVLVGELVGRGSLFRAHDAMDYLIHRLIFTSMGRPQDVPLSFAIYRWGSILVGVVAVGTALSLLRRSRIDPVARIGIFLLWFFSAATLLYCGYVESYGPLSVAMLGFLWSGAMTMRGEARPVLPGIFFGFALFFHLMAILAAPALIWLVMRPGGKPALANRRRFEILAPAIGLPLLGVLIHVALGYDGDWFRREFLESKNQKSVLVPLTGSHGLLSLQHWRDLLNWILLVVPVPALLIATRLGTLRRRVREAEILFLLAQIVPFTGAFVLLDRKIGSSRDWDIFAPHIAGICWLAVRLWEGEKKGAAAVDSRRWPAVVRNAPYVALLLAWPWFAVNTSRDLSLARFDRLRSDFARFPRAYATEELAKYYRDQGEIQKAFPLYKESVEIYPNNARTRVLLGSSYFVLDRYEEANAEFDAALRLDPDNWLALDMKSKVALKRGDFAAALPIYRKLAPARGADPDMWAGYGYSALQLREFEEAYQAFRRAASLRRDPEIDYFWGLTASYVGRWDEAVEGLTRAMRGEEQRPLVLFALATALEGRYTARLQAGQAADSADLDSARRLADQAGALAPDDALIARYRTHIERVIAKEEPPGWRN